MKYKTITSVLTAALIVLLCNTSVFAQTEMGMSTPDSSRIAPITRAGSMMFMFSLNGPSSFGLAGPSANGSGDPRVFAGAGMKYYLSDRLAGRLLLSFGTTSSGPDSAKTPSNIYGIGVGLEYHCHDLFAISPYFGGGIGYTTQSVTVDSTSKPAVSVGKLSGITPLAQTIPTVTTTKSAFAISALAGFDWFFAKGIAIGSEFSLGFVSGSTSITSTGGVNLKGPATTAFGFSGIGNVHLLVYF